MFSSLATAIFGGVDRNANEPITAKLTERGSVQQGDIDSFAFSGMQGWRVTMEDAHMVCTNIPVQGGRTLSPGHAIFGVMDGHGGDFTSGYAAENFMRIFSATSGLKQYAALSPADQADVPGINLLRPALAEAFSVLDVETRKRQNKRNDTVLQMTEQMEQLHQQQAAQKSHGVTRAPNSAMGRVRFERSGSTCVVVMVTPTHIICANAGDSRAILRRRGQSLPLSFDHKPNNVGELMRINQAGGFVKSKRVDGDLAVSRGLGDFSYKSNESKPVGLQKVIPDPEFVVYPRDVSGDEFLVLACDGIWDVATNEQCGDFVQGLMDDGEADLGLICEEALDHCLELNSRDNMTLSVVTFAGARIPSGLQVRNAVWQRRTARQARMLEQTAKMAASRAAANVGLTFGLQDGRTAAV